MLGSYSQNGEDLKIAELFSEPGRLLDIGAWGVRDFSNSRLFIEKDWEAVLVEFSPGPVRSLVQEYGRHPKVTVVQAAVTPEPNHVLRFEITDNALSTNSDAKYELWKEAGGYFGSLWVQTISLEALLHQFFGDKTIDYATIDTEGSSVDLAIALLHSDHRPKVLCVEHDEKLVRLMEHAQCYGYRQHWLNQENVILAR